MFMCISLLVVYYTMFESPRVVGHDLKKKSNEKQCSYICACATEQCTCRTCLFTSRHGKQLAAVESDCFARLLNRI